MLGAGSVGIIFGHQTNGSMCQWIATARTYAAKGYRTLVFDFAGFGLAQQTTSATTTADMVSAATYLRTLGVTRIALVGASFGGAAVVTASVTAELPVAAVVSLSGSTQLRTTEEPAKAAARLTAPLFCTAARTDGRGAYADVATQMCASNSPGPRQLMIVDGSEHGVVLYEDNAEVRGAVEAFLARYAPPA
jgi:pimeloyl-ACP methyl ester carboxylesterase